MHRPGAGDLGSATEPGNLTFPANATSIGHSTQMNRSRHSSIPLRAPNLALGLILLALGPGVQALVEAETRPPANALEHWAFQPPAKAEPPKVANSRWLRTDIDRFILAKLEAASRAPAPAADARTLIRRMSFDLTGLPPTSAEVEQFVKATARDCEQAIRELIDRLLASPRYGERWGRHWLDVARYSDTKGYVYDREERRFVHAPTYRDWVIRAFNDDLPYDRFLLLQMAGDQLLPKDSPDLAAWVSSLAAAASSASRTTSSTTASTW